MCLSLFLLRLLAMRGFHFERGIKVDGEMIIPVLSAVSGLASWMPTQILRYLKSEFHHSLAAFIDDLCMSRCCSQYAFTSDW